MCETTGASRTLLLAVMTRTLYSTAKVCHDLAEIEVPPLVMPIPEPIVGTQAMSVPTECCFCPA